MNDSDLRTLVKPLLEGMSGPEEVYKLFKELNYPESKIMDTSYQREAQEFDMKDDIQEKIENIFTVLNFDGDLPVFLIECDSLKNKFLKYVTKKFSDNYLKSLLIFTTDYEEFAFVFPEFELEEAGKQKLKLTKLKFNRNNLYYSDIDAISKIYLEDEDKNWRFIWEQWKEAFNVKRVTEDFFEDYKDKFFRLRDHILDQGESVEDAHEFVLQLMNRLMFIYFVDKKGWLEKESEDESYIYYLWERYREENEDWKDGKNRFYSEWLETLFHKGLNNKFNSSDKLPDDVADTLVKAPYLNGGLFREDDTADLDAEIDDKLLGKIIEDFFENYNFTIREDMPLNEEVAVDPKMIGYVYESLSNVAEKLDEIDKDSRKEFGIFYTPREEVYFMVRRSLVEYLNERVDVDKEDLYRLVFAESNKEKREIRKKIDEQGKAFKIRNVLSNANIVDPACGSGAFLVGMLNVMADIYEEMYKTESTSPRTFDIKKQIIGRSLYGVDVKDWAINASELRLFLQLLIETDISKERARQDALLPNLRANLRVGDSLVQDIEGEFIDVRGDHLSTDVHDRLDELREEKGKFFKQRQESRFNGITDIQAYEINVFIDVLDDKIDYLEEKLGEKKTKQQTLNGGVREPSSSEKRKITKKKKEAKQKVEKFEELKEKLAKNPDKLPLVWDIAFAEVFENRDGFDVVIGNPPYVRQEDIRPPNMDIEDVTKEDKKEYKNKLIESVQEHMPQVEKISKRSDLYIYFFFHGLSILNENGTFCFITSNSWLDVGYGKHLQRFLCKYVPIKGIYNNKSNRSFEHADVNTVISIFGAPRFETVSFDGWTIPKADNGWPAKDHEARFITFKKPYREAVSTENLLALEDSDNYEKKIQLDRSQFRLYNTNELRSVKIQQHDLLEDGWDYPNDYDGESFKKGKYKGNKWGGKFLRAPDIFFDILENSAEKLGEIGEIADEVQRGISTGANDFFFVEKVTDKISSIENIENSHRFESLEEIEKGGFEVVKPSKYSEIDSAKLFVVDNQDLNPAFQNTNEVETLEINEVPTAIFAPTDTDISNISKDYVKWGEAEGFNTTYTCKKRDPWWDLRGHTTKEATKIGFNYNIHDTGHFYFSRKPRFYSDNFHTINYEDNSIQVLGESTLGVLMINIFCRTPFGGGKAKLQTYELEEIPIPKPHHLSSNKVEEVWEKKVGSKIKLLFDEIGLERNKPIREQEPDPLPDRKELDDIVFDALGLSEEERKEVYWAVAELVKARLDKAESV